MSMVLISHPELVLSGRCKLIQRVLLSAHMDSGAASSFLLSRDCFFSVFPSSAPSPCFLPRAVLHHKLLCLTLKVFKELGLY